MNVDGTNARPFIPPFPEEYTSHRRIPKWSADGAEVLYVEIDLKTEIREHPGGKKSIRIWYAGTFRLQILNKNNRSVRKLKIPTVWSLQSVAWMHRDKAVLFSAVPHRNEPLYEEVVQLYKYDIATDTIMQLTHDTIGSVDGDWVSDDPSTITQVSPKGKLSARWGELKKLH